MLPLDLRNLLAHADGIHLWANLEEGRSYFGILPLAEWQPGADRFGWDNGACAVVMSYGANGDALALHPDTGDYRWHDLEDYAHVTVVGSRVDQLLDFVWNESRDEDPRRNEANRIVS